MPRSARPDGKPVAATVQAALAVAAETAVPRDPAPALHLLRDSRVHLTQETMVELTQAAVKASARVSGASPRVALAALRALGRRGGVPTASLVSCAVAACSRTGKTKAGDGDPAWAAAGVRLAREALEAGAPVEVGLVQSMLQIAARVRSPEIAAEALSLAPHGRARDSRGRLGHGTLELACRARMDDPAAVRATIAQYREWGVSPSPQAYNVLIRAAGRARNADAVVAVLSEMREAGLLPGNTLESTMRAVVDGLAPDSVELAADLVAEFAGDALKNPSQAVPLRHPEASDYASVAAAMRAEGWRDAAAPSLGPVVLDLHGLSRGGAAVATLHALRVAATGPLDGKDSKRRRRVRERVGVGGRGGTRAVAGELRGLVLIVGRGPRADYRRDEPDTGGLRGSVADFLAKIGVQPVSPDPSNPGRLVVTPTAVAAWAAADTAARDTSAAFNVRARAATAVAGLTLGVGGLWAVWPSLVL